jgi:hypothetical protein
MTTIEIAGTDLVVHVEGLDRFWALRSELRVPLAHVAGVGLAGDEAKEWWHGLRVVGSHIPGVFSAGTFYERQGHVFWDVHNPSRAIAIRLHDERFAKLILEVENPDAEIAKIDAALAP